MTPDLKHKCLLCCFSFALLALALLAIKRLLHWLLHFSFSKLCIYVVLLLYTLIESSHSWCHSFFGSSIVLLSERAFYVYIRSLFPSAADTQALCFCPVEWEMNATAIVKNKTKQKTDTCAMYPPLLSIILSLSCFDTAHLFHIVLILPFSAFRWTNRDSVSAPRINSEKTLEARHTSLHLHILYALNSTPSSKLNAIGPLSLSFA